MTRPSRRARRLLATLALAALLAPVATRAAAPPRPVLSVLYFENRTGKPDYDVLRKGLADMMVTDLTAWDGVTVVERERLESVLTELKLQRTRAFDARKRQQIGKLLGAQYLLVGTMNLAGTTLALDAQLIEVRTGVVRIAARASGGADRVFDLEQDLVARIASAIDVKLKDPGRRRVVKVPNLKTLLDYSRAVDLADRGRLDEAHAALRKLVSASPTFLMARERRERILKQLEEHGRRRVEIVSASVIQLGRIVDDALKGEARFARLDPAAQGKFLGMRILRGRILGRLLRQHLSSRDRGLKVILRGHEAAALKLLRAIAENYRRLLAELAQVGQGNGVSSLYLSLGPEVDRLVRDGGFGDNLSLSGNHLSAFVRFVLQGRVSDGPSTYTVAPALGDLDPREQKAAFELLDRGVRQALAEYARTPPSRQRQFEARATGLLEEKAEALLRLDQDEAAAGAYQKILDAFPTGYRAPWVERRIKQIAGASHDYERSLRERWAKALTTCADMDIRVGEGTLTRRLRRMGLAALAAQAAELEKACKPNAKNRHAFAFVYRSLASTAVTHEDCAAYRYWSRKYLEADGSAGDLRAYHKWTPWCELGNVLKNVTWMRTRYDDHWTLDLDRHLVSVRSYNGKVLTLFGRKDGEKTELTLYLDATGPTSFTCRKAQWRKLDGRRLEGTCTVRLTHVAREKGEFDEGTFTAEFPTTGIGGRPWKSRMTRGEFRLRRQ